MNPLPFPGRGSPRRPTPLRARRRYLRLAVLAFVLILLAALAYGVHLLSYIEALSIGKIRVSGVQKIDPTIIESYVDSQLDDGSFHYFSRRNIFFYPKEAIAARIGTSFPRVKSASLSREAPLSRELHVAIVEREPYALWCLSEEDCYALDETGLAFTTAATTTHGEFKTHYIFSGGISEGPIGMSFVPGQFPFLISLLSILQQETNLIPTRVAVLPDQDFTVLLEQGFYVKASFGQDAGALARNLELVLSSDVLRDRINEIEYVDLRFGNRVYYKIRGEEQRDI